MTAWHGRRPRLRVIIALAGAISSLVPALVCAAGFSVTRQVTTLDVHRTGHYTETVERTLRIDSPAGIDDHDQWSLTYNPERTKLEIVEAWTQTRSGQRIPVPRNRIMVRERTQADRDYLFSGRVALVVIHPQVEVGSLLHVHWRASHVPIYPGHFAWRRPVDPQDPPGEWTLRMAHEPGMPMRVHQAGFAGGELAPDARGWRRLEFRVDRDAIVRSETQRRRAPEGRWLMVAFSTYASWAEVARIYRRGADVKAAVTPAIHAHAMELIRGAGSTRERVQRLHDWVRRNIRYLGVQSDRGAALVIPAEEVLRTRYGDCKDKSALLQALLAAVGIPAQAVLINDGWWVELPSLPTPFFFSHVMVHIPSMGLYLDPTASELPMGVLSTTYMDKPVLQVGLGRVGRTPASNPGRDGTRAEVVMEMRPDGTVYGSSRTSLTGHAQVDLRYELADGADTDKLVANVLATRGEWGTGSTEVVSEADAPELEVSMRFDLKSTADLPGPALLRIPRGAAPDGMLHYLKQADRGPQACHSERHAERLSLTLPRGRTLEGKLPAAASFSRGVLTYRSHYGAVQDGEQTRLEVTRELIAHCTSRLLTVADRRHLEELRDVLMRDLRAQVVLR